LIVIIVAVIVVVAIVAAALAFSKRQRSSKLRERFGPEYERTVNSVGDRSRAESMLEKRQERVEKFHIRDLAPEDQRRFGDAWRSTQARFVDSPSDAIRDAERLVTEVMTARGYPMADFEQRAADISVDHPDVVTNYRAARQVAQANERGEASTEDLRQAMVHYRALFEDLLGRQQPTRTEVRR
jgi:FtsZ-interacting cell division protein ZipA